MFIERRIFDNEVTPFYALFICVWSTILLEAWKRQNMTYNHAWGMLDFEATESVRSEWVATRVKKSPVTGKLIRYNSLFRASAPYFISMTVVFLFILLVLAAVSATIVFRAWMSVTMSSPTLASIISAFVSFSIMMTLDFFYGMVTKSLTDLGLPT